MKVFWIYLSCLLLANAVLSGQELNINFEEFTLDNGLQAIVHQDTMVSTVAIVAMYHVGSKNEDPNRTGFAHFFEHLLFEGSENMTDGTFTQYVEDAGGTTNAYTTPDVTCYFELLPSNQLELGLWLESERMLHATIEEEGIAKQRALVKEEMHRRYDERPYGTYQKEILKRVYQKYPYKWPVFGLMQHLDESGKEDFDKFYNTYYVPDNAVLAIAGDIDIKQTKAWVEKYFGSIPKSKALLYRPDVKEPSLEKEIRDTIYDEVQLPAIFYAYRTPPLSADDFYATQMLIALLADGENTRLSRLLVDKYQKAASVGGFVLGLEGPGLSIAYAVASAGVPLREVEAIIEDQIRDLQEVIIPDKEFQRLRSKMESQLLAERTTMLGIAEQLASFKTLYDDASLINTSLDKYLNVTREDIKKAAQKYFTRENRVGLYYLPKNLKP
jgi:zinc protease